MKSLNLKNVGKFSLAAMAAFALSVAPVSAAALDAGQEDFDAGYLQPLVQVAELTDQYDNLAQVDLDDEGVNDPLEPVNRVIFDFNEIVFEYVLGPIAHTYIKYIPVKGRRGVSNFLQNLSEPVNLANNLLQLEFKRAGDTAARLAVNSTVGVLGVLDVADGMGLELAEEDFGQTLGVWGVGEGFYVVLPVFGPSSPRDAVGKLLVDSYFDPVGMYLSNTDQDEISYTLLAVGGVAEYAGVVEDLEQIKKTSIDYYAAIRSLYRQKRKSEISNGSEVDLPPIPDIGYNLLPEEENPSVAGTAIN